MQSLSRRAFLDPEREVVFESVRALLRLGPISLARLRVHLNNRGFPDIDVEKYFLPTRADRIERRSSGEIES